jgi:uncharacterized protein (DUF486 family)
MTMNLTLKVVFWIFLNLLLVAFMDLALFMQTTFKATDNNIYKKLITSEFWATMEWLILIPAQRIGNSFLNPVQLNLSSFVFDFIGQIFTNNFWLKIETTLDDYIGMIVILFAMYSSKMKIFG